MSELKLDDLEYDLRESINIIEAERDKIRDILSEINALEENVTDALEELESGLETLSTYL